MSKKEEAEEQLKNCEEMHIWVKPIKDYIKELEAKEERAKKVEELLELYRYVWSTPILSQTISFEEAINLIDKLEEELK